MRVLRIWHAAVVAEYRKKIQALAQLPEIDLLLLIPSSWKEGGKEVKYHEVEEIDSEFKTNIGRVISRNNIRRYIYLLGLFRSMAYFRPHIIDLEEEPFAYVTAQIIFYCKLLGLESKIIFHTAHNIRKPMKKSFEYVQKLSFRKCHAAIVRNKESKFILQEKGFRKPIFISGNGIDIAHFAPGSSEQLKNELNLTNKKIIGFIGKLKTGKPGTFLATLDEYKKVKDPSHTKFTWYCGGCNDTFEMPVWLLKKYNPEVDFNDLRWSQKIVIPVITKIAQNKADIVLPSSAVPSENFEDKRVIGKSWGDLYYPMFFIAMIIGFVLLMKRLAPNLQEKFKTVSSFIQCLHDY